MPSSFSRTYTTETPNPIFDLDDSIGQRRLTYRFDLVDIVTGYRTAVHPRRDTVPTLSHNVSRSIVRQLSGLNFTVDDSALLDTITSRIEVFMVIEGDTAFPDGRPLGRYMFNSKVDFIFTSGTISAGILFDEGFIVDQPISEGFGASAGSVAQGGTTARCENLIHSLLDPLPIETDIETSPFDAIGASWPAGTQRGYIIEQLALDGDWFSPWFSNDTKMHFIRSFDPADALVTFDLDSGNRVLRDSISKTDDLIEAPNRFVVISNSTGAMATPIVGIYDVPSSAPHSIARRGFVIPHVENRQIDSSAQVTAVARNLGLQQTIFERLELFTPPDPRHDAYDVLRWQGDNWLEISWSLPLIEGADMQHIARKVYVA